MVDIRITGSSEMPRGMTEWQSAEWYSTEWDLAKWDKAEWHIVEQHYEG